MIELASFRKNFDVVLLIVPRRTAQRFALRKDSAKRFGSIERCQDETRNRSKRAERAKSEIKAIDEGVRCRRALKLRSRNSTAFTEFFKIWSE